MNTIARTFATATLAIALVGTTVALTTTSAEAAGSALGAKTTCWSCTSTSTSSGGKGNDGLGKPSTIRK